MHKLRLLIHYISQFQICTIRILQEDEGEGEGEGEEEEEGEGEEEGEEEEEGEGEEEGEEEEEGEGEGEREGEKEKKPQSRPTDILTRGADQQVLRRTIYCEGKPGANMLKVRTPEPGLSHDPDPS